MIAEPLTPEEQRRLELLRSLHGGESLAEFIGRVAPRHAPPPRHLWPLIDLFERARSGPVRALVSFPPGSAKTLTALRAIVWWLSKSPADLCAYLSYSDVQGWTKSKICRDIALDAGLQLKQDMQSAGEWRLAAGGGLVASGVGGRLTGTRVTGMAIVDDAVKSRKDAESETLSDDAWNWWTDVVRTRLEGGASVFVIGTRWAPDDLIGRLAEQDGWTVLNVPAVAGANDSIGRAPGEVWWPGMYPPAEVDSLRRELGEYSFAALYQGEPRARGLCVFSPAATFYDPRSVDFTGCIAIIGADPAATARSSADHSVAVAIAVRSRGTPDGLPIVYIVDRFKAQIEVPAFARALVDFQRRNWHAPIAVEAVAGFKAVPQLLRELAPGIALTEIHPIGDKFTRAQGLAAAWNSGRVLVPLGAPWVEDFVRVLSRFTGTGADREDDDVDAAAHAFNTALDVTTKRPVFRGAVLALDRWP